MKLWILFVICCILPAFSSALKCYECSTVKGEKECKNPTDKFAKDCPSGAKGCQTLTFKFNNEDHITRGCGIGTDKTSGCEEKTEGGTTGKFCYCSGDKCNSSNLITSNLFIFVPMCLAIIYNSIWLF